MIEYYTYCPHNSDSSSSNKISLGNIAPKINMVQFCVDCKRSCKIVSLEPDGDQIYVHTIPVFQHSIDPYLDPDLFDDEGLEIE